jgi:ubiquinol-cytochrome c reductase cytochrome b subunit
MRYKGLGSKILLAVFVIAFIRLGMLGLGTGTEAETIESRIWTFVYFAFFILMPFVTKYEKTKPEPERVSK